jgi:hypothetical protein
MERRTHQPSRLNERRLNNGLIGATVSPARRFMLSLGQVAVMLVVMAGQVPAESVGSSGSVANVIRGDVLNIEGDTYTIKDMSGHEVSLRVNGETKHEDRIKVGDKVQAQVGSDGTAQSIRVQLPDDVSPSR